jgi:uncharacterized protein (TIGR02246 family)
MSELQEVADRLAIRELSERYCLGVTRRDWDAMAACFHEDGRWVTSVGHDFRGRQAIKDGIRETVESFEFLVQMPHTVTVSELTATRAKANTILNEFGRALGGQSGVNVLGVYHDIVTKQSGRWEFEERYFEAYYIDPATPGGMKLVDYATRR